MSERGKKSVRVQHRQARAWKRVTKLGDLRDRVRRLHLIDWSPRRADTEDAERAVLKEMITEHFPERTEDLNPQCKV